MADGKLSIDRSAPQRSSAAIVYAIDGDLRFLSHQDELRALTRACVRAKWPVAFSQGFNPQAQVGIPLPRSVATACSEQWAVIQLGEQAAPRALFETLRPALDGYLGLRAVYAPLAHRRLHARQVKYEVALESSDASLVAGRLDQLLASDSIPIMRTHGPGKPKRPIDIRPYLESVRISGAELRMSLIVDQQRTARPSEVMEAIGLDTDRYGHRTNRTTIRWVENVDTSPRWPVQPERKHSEQHEDRAQDRQTCGHQA